MQNLNLKFCGLPGHVGIEGNETANQYSKNAANPENVEEL
jgi:hypothetical protein